MVTAPGPSSHMEMWPLNFGSNNAVQESMPPGTLSVRYRIDVNPQSHGMKYCLPSTWPSALNRAGISDQWASRVVSSGITRLSRT